MLTLEELKDLKEKFARGEVTFEVAKDLALSDLYAGKKSWHTKDWKERRAKFLKDECQICSSKERLTIQHLSHPGKYPDFERAVTRKYTDTFIDSNSEFDTTAFEAHIKSHYEYHKVPMCPDCGSRNPYMRKRLTPIYRCTDCKHEFDEPIYDLVDDLLSAFFRNEDTLATREKCFVTKDKWGNKHNLSNAKYWYQRNMTKSIDENKIQREALLLCLDDQIKYLSFEDTITTCNRCAYKFDTQRMELCPSCKTYYKVIQYPTCIQCLPEEKRIAALEAIEFGKQMRQIHKDLGID